MQQTSHGFAAGLFILALLLAFANVSAEDRPALGVTFATLDSDRCDEWKTGDISEIEYGVIIWVFPESPADDAGLLTGDVLIQFNGQRIDEPVQTREIVQSLKPGDDFVAVVFRNGLKREFVGKLGVYNPDIFN